MCVSSYWVLISRAQTPACSLYWFCWFAVFLVFGSWCNCFLSSCHDHKIQFFVLHLSLSLCFVCIFLRLFRVNNLCSCLSLVCLSSVHLVELLCSDILFAVVCYSVLRCFCRYVYFVRYFVRTLLSRLAYLEIKIYIYIVTHTYTLS